VWRAIAAELGEIESVQELRTAVGEGQLDGGVQRHKLPPSVGKGRKRCGVLDVSNAETPLPCILMWAAGNFGGNASPIRPWLSAQFIDGYGAKHAHA
jgi:hypothetical protein